MTSEASRIKIGPNPESSLVAVLDWHLHGDHGTPGETPLVLEAQRNL